MAALTRIGLPPTTLVSFRFPLGETTTITLDRAADAHATRQVRVGGRDSGLSLSGQFPLGEGPSGVERAAPTANKSPAIAHQPHLSGNALLLPGDISSVCRQCPCQPAANPEVRGNIANTAINQLLRGIWRGARVLRRVRFCLRRGSASHSETVRRSFPEVSHLGTPNVISLTQIEITVYFSIIFNYL